jgi:hypothetical protein
MLHLRIPLDRYFDKYNTNFTNTKAIILDSTSSEVSSDIYFAVYVFYYVGQHDDPGIRTGPVHRDGGSNFCSFCNNGFVPSMYTTIFPL